MWKGLCATWNLDKKHIVSQKPANWHEKKLLPLWSTHVIHRNTTSNGCKSKAQLVLRDGGITTLGDIMHPDWESLPSPPHFVQEQRAYEHLTINVDLTKARATKSQKCKKNLSRRREHGKTQWCGSSRSGLSKWLNNTEWANLSLCLPEPSGLTKEGSSPKRLPHLKRTCNFPKLWLAYPRQPQ